MLFNHVGVLRDKVLGNRGGLFCSEVVNGTTIPVITNPVITNLVITNPAITIPARPGHRGTKVKNVRIVEVSWRMIIAMRMYV